MMKTFPLMLLLAAAATANEEPAQAWAMFGRDLQNTNHYPFETGSAYKQVWKVRVGCPAPGMSSTIVDDRGTYNTSPCSNTGDVHAVGLDGKVAWSHGVGQGKGGIISTPCVHDGILYCVDNGIIRAFDAKDGTQKWEQEVTTGKVSISSPIVYDGKLYLNATDGVQILALDRSKSAEDKTLPIEGGHGGTTPAFHKGSMILMGLQHVYSFDTKTLKENWKVELPMEYKERLIHSPIIDIASDRVFVASSKSFDPEGWLRCLNFADGKLLWQKEIKGMSMTPCMTFDSKQLYLAALDGSISAFNGADGELRWTWNIPGEVRNAEGKLNYNRQPRAMISSKNKLVFCTSEKLCVISNDEPEGIDFETTIGNYGSPTPAFHRGDLYFRYRTREEGAHNYRFTEVKQAAADIEVKINRGTAHIRNLTPAKLNFIQLCYGINVNEKQNCVPLELELQAGEKTDLDLERFMTIDESLTHLLFSLQYEKPGGEGEFHDYFTISSDKPGK